MITIQATFINRPSSAEVAELIHAWDDGQIEDNPVGYKETLQKELDALGDDLLNTVRVRIKIPNRVEDKIIGRLNPDPIDVEVADG